MPSASRHALAAVLFTLCGTAHAAQITDVRIDGLDEAMTENVRLALSLEDARGKRVSDARLEYLLRVAEDETREALEPLGYYSPDIAITESAAGAALAEDAPVSVVIVVRPGEPVRIRSAQVAMLGDAEDDRYLKEEIDAFTPKVGDVLEHAKYEQSKAFITRRLAERGYFDADFAARKIEVTRAEKAADIDLRWDSGDRYAMGTTVFEQAPETIIRDSVLQNFVYWEEGDYYHQGRLDRLRKSLGALDYFSRIDIQPQPENAVDGRVPVTVRLTPAKRSIYSVGASFGTDSGFGVSLGLERRYLNSRGHKGLAQLDYAQKRKTLTLQHRIPAFAWRDGWYTTSVQAYDEQTDYIDPRRYEAVFSRNGQYNRELNLVASLLQRVDRRHRRPPAPGQAVPAVDLLLSLDRRRIHQGRRPHPAAQRFRRQRDSARGAGGRGFRRHLRAVARARQLVQGPGRAEPLDRAWRSGFDLHRRAGGNSADPALLRRRRPQRARLRIPRDRAADRCGVGPREFRAGCEERGHHQRRIRAVSQRHLGLRRLRRQRQRFR